MSAATDGLEREMGNNGLRCQEPIIDNGKINRFHVEGDSRGTTNGFYRFWNDDNPTVYYGSHKTGEKLTFSLKNPKDFSPEEQQRHNARMQEGKAASERLRVEKATQAAIEARRIWDASKPAAQDHPYLVRKQVQAHGIQFLDQRLVIPLYDATGEMVSIQFVDRDGTKRFLTGGSVQGNHFSIGEATEVIYICEGFSTGATIHEATNSLTVVAFNCGNLKAVAEVIRGQYPEANIILAGDDDCWDEKAENPGREKGEKASKAINAQIVFPVFKNPDDKKPTDFNDLFILEGLKEIKRQLEPPEPVELWPEPVPLIDETLPSLPLAGLPAWFKDMIEAVSKNTETPPELAAMLGLTALSTAAHRAFEIEPKPGYKEPLNIWGIVPMESGNRKTSVQTAMTAPLGVFEREQAEATTEERKKSESNLRTLEARIKHKRAEAARIDDTEEYKASCKEISILESELIPVQASLQLWAQDVTPEKLATVMAEQGGSLAILSDEGGVFETFAGRYNGGIPNLDLILKSHSGSAIRIHRASRETISMDHPSLVFGLSPQPDVLRGLSDKPSFRGRGLLARFLYVVPKSLLGERSLDSPPVPESIASGYLTGLTNILNVKIPESNERHVLKFSKQAHVEWKDFSRWVELELRQGGRFEHIKDWAGKLPGAAARIAGLLHVAEHHHHQPHDVLVSVETMAVSANMMMAFSAHALHAFGVMAADPNIEKAKKILDWIRRKECQEFTRRDCHHGLQQHFPRVDDLMTGIKVLVERYIVRLEQPTAREGRPSAIYGVNPAIFQENK